MFPVVGCYLIGETSSGNIKREYPMILLVSEIKDAQYMIVIRSLID